MKKILLAAAGAASVFAMTPAHAAAVIQPTTVQNRLDPGANGAFSIGFSDADLAASFTETLTFTTDMAGTLAVSLTTASSSLDFTNVFLSGTGITSTFNFGGNTFTGIQIPQVLANPETLFREINLASAGTFTLNINGVSRAADAGFGGSVSMSAVPEPATWAMMLFGFGAVGYSMRGRRKIGLKLHQAV
jgi:hypothetical protein